MPGDIVITAKRQRGQLILTAGPRRPISRSTPSSTRDRRSPIGNTALRDKLIRKGRAKFYEVEAIGVTGEQIKLQIGGHR